jgi:hypothetical protein
MANTAQLKMLNWGDDLRLPTFTDSAEFMPIVQQLEEYRSPSIPLQSKHLPSLKRNVWFAMKRPEDSSRPGLLCFWPLKKCCIYVQGKRVALMRLRVDPHLLMDNAGLSLFVATLSPSSRNLWIEDTLMWKGRRFHTESFKKRWSIAKQCVDNCIIPDSKLNSGIQIELCTWGPLSSIKSDGSWDLISDDSRTRLYWKGTPQHKKHCTGSQKEIPIEKSADSTDILSIDPPAVLSAEKPDIITHINPPTIVVQDVLVAAANRESGPDQWSLSSSDGVSLGRGLIRKMVISSSLNKSGQHTFVQVSWNSEFNKWEINSIHSGPASASSFFALPK